MKTTIIVLMVLIVITLVNAKKWSDKDINEQEHHHNHKVRKHEFEPQHDVVREERKREKENYYRSKQFADVDHKLIQKHSPIAVSEDDARLQADLDDGNTKEERKRVRDELYRQHLIGAEEGKMNEMGKKEEKEKKHHSHSHHYGNNKKHGDNKDVTKSKDKPMSIPDVDAGFENKYERQEGKGGKFGKHGRKEKKDRRQKENKRQQEKQEKQKKQKKRYGYKKESNGKRYKMTVYESKN